MHETDRPVIEAFWDRAHLRPDLNWVVDNHAELIIECLEPAGPFRESLAKARRVLEVGPGTAQLLRSLPAGVARYAFEISPLARDRLESWGIVALPPDYIGVPSNIDLAWCLSVFQHCGESTVRDLLRRIARSLSPYGGEAYLQAVECRNCPGGTCAEQSQNHPQCQQVYYQPDRELRLLGAGSVVVPMDQFIGWAREAGLEPVGPVGSSRGMVSYPESAIAGYVVRFRRAG